ncbi:MAG: ABC transporter permease [Alphaproteobacteria bacterium]|nr:ABC transporter permease [Alphaproteobacteria bacterium]
MTSEAYSAPPMGPVGQLRAAIRGALFRYAGLRGYILLSPTLLVLVGAMCLPVGILLVYSFWTQNYIEIDHTLTLANYIKVFTKQSYMLLIGKSVLISFTVTVTTVILAYPIAYFIAFKVNRYKIVWLILITVPFLTSYLLRVFAWKIILGYNGIINSGLKWLGIIDQPLTFLLHNPTAVVITLAHAWAPIAILPIFVSLEKMDRSLLEAATDLGDTPLQRFLRVTLPLSIPGVVASSMLVFIPTVGDYITPQLVGGPDGMMVGSLMHAMFFRANDWPLGSALAIISAMAITLTSLGIWLLTKQARARAI